MTASITISFHYNDDDRPDASAACPPDPKWLRVSVKGEHAIIHMFLPTVPLESLADTNWGSWIDTIQGPLFGRCDVTATQRQLLLDITLTYRAFTSGTAGVGEIWYTNFIRTLINIARSHTDAKIDQALTNLTSALRVLLPRAIFNSPDIPPVTYDPEPLAPTSASRARRAAPHAHGGSAMTPVASVLSAESDVPAPVPLLDDIYAAVPRRSVDEGYDSDSDTMPTLRTVSDSSDSDYE